MEITTRRKGAMLVAQNPAMSSTRFVIKIYRVTPQQFMQDIGTSSFSRIEKSCFEVSPSIPHFETCPFEIEFDNGPPRFFMAFFHRDQWF